MKQKQFFIAFVAMVLCFSFTASAQQLLVNCDYNSSTEGYGTTKFSNYAGAYAYATANATSATIVIEKTNTLSGNTFDNNHKNYSKLAVVIKDGATMGNAASKWDMTYPVTVEPGGTLTCARPKTASVSYIHIKNKLIVGAKGATKKAYVNFLSDTYQDCDISIRYNGSIEVYNADFEVQDLDAQGKLTIEDSNVKVDGAFASATSSLYPTTITNTEMVVNGSLISGGLSDFAGGTSNQLGNVTLNNSTLTIKEGDTKVATAKFLAGTMIAKASTIEVNNLTITDGATLNLNEGSTLTAENITTAGTGSVKIDGVAAKIENGQIVTPVAKIGDVEYATLAEAVAAVEDGGTITLVANETFTENNRYNNGGWWDGLGYSGDKSFTIDLADFTISQDGALNDYLMWFKNDGAKANTITLKNGTLDAGTTAYSALATSSSNAQKITVNLENIKVINNNNSGSTVKVRGGAELNVKDGTVITGKDSYLGIECIASTANIYDGAEIYMNGTSSYNGCLAGVGGNGTINVYGGEGQSKSGGFIAMTSGGTVNVEGGEWIANNDGTYANNNKSVLVAQSDKQYNAGAGNSVVNVTGGTFKGGYNCYGNKAGDAQINISGGNFNSNPSAYVKAGYVATESAGIYTVVEAPAYIDGKASYASLADAYEAAVDGDVIVLNESVTTFPVIKKAVTFKGGKENAAVEINVFLAQNFTAINGTVKFENLTFNKPLFTEQGGTKPGLTIEFEGCNFNVPSDEGYAILIGTSWSNSVVKGLKVNECNFKYVGDVFKGGYMLYVQCVNEVSITNNTIDGNNLYRGAIHLGDATEHATVATVSNNTIKNFCRGVMMGNRVAGSSATISGNTFDNINYSDKDSKPAQECAPIFIHSNAKAEALQIALTNNKVENCANPMIYSEDTDLIKYYVTEFTGNTVGGTAVELANSYNAPNQVFPVATINDAEYFTLQAAVDAVNDGETITLVSDVTENVTLTEKTGLYYTIDGADKTMKGSINVNSLSDTNDNRRITIKNIKFVDDSDANVDFITSVNTNHYPRLTVEGCTFTGSGNDGDVAIRLKSSHSVVIKDCTGTGLHSFLQNTSGWNLTIENVTVTNSKSGLALGTVQGVTVKGSNIVVPGYGIRLDANTYNNNAVIESNTVEAFIPVVVRKVNTESNITFNGTNTMTATNTDGIWCAIGTSEYETNGQMPTAATGKVKVALNDTGLSEEGIYGNYYDELTIHVASQTATTSVTRDIYVATMDEAVAEAKTFNAGTVIYKVYGAVELTTGGSHGILDLGENVVIEGADPAAKLTIVGGGVPDIKGVTFKNITLADEGTYLPTANEFMYQNYIDCTFENVKFVDGIRLSGTSVVKDCEVDANTTNEYAIWLDEGEFTMTGTTVVGGADAYGLIKSDVVSKITITGNTFQYLGEANKEALNTKGAVIIAENNTFIDCAAGILPADKTNYADDSKTTVLTDAGIAENNTVTVYYAAIGEQKYETLLAAIKAAQEGDTITLIRDVTMDYNARDAYDTQAQNVVINGNDNTLTLNQKNSDWASIGLANNSKLVLNNMTIEKTGYGDTSGAWNTHAIIFTCPVEMSNVTVNNSVAVQAGATLNNVTINEANEYYGLWINGNGQEVTINGGSITATNGGRGIKIADQYIDSPAQVTLSVTGTVFTTAKKAAVLVSSKGGAKITASNVNIENVAEDKVNFVWVDEDWAQYFDQVEVTGATVSVESAGSFAAAITVDGTAQSYYKTLAAAITAAQPNDVITFVNDITENVTISKNVTIDGANKKYTGTMTGNAGLNVTVQNVNFVNGGFAKAKSTTGSYTIKDCTFDGAGSYYYALAIKGANTVNVENCTVNNYQYGFLYVSSGTNSVSVKDVTVENCPSYAVYFASGVNNAMFENLTVKNSNNGFTINNTANRAFTMKNCKMENVATAINHSKGTNTITCTVLGVNDLGTALSEYAVIKGATIEGSTLYGSVQGMVAKAENGQTVKLLSDTTMETSDELASCDGYPSFVHLEGKAVTVDLNGKAITANATAEELAGKMLIGVFSTDKGGELTLVDSSAEGTGSVTLNANDAKVYSLLCNYNPGCKIIVNGGTYTADKVSDCLIFSGAQVDDLVTINGGNFTLGNVGTGENGKPWIFNVLGAGDNHVLVKGGTFNADINRQHWSNEVVVPETHYTVANADGTYTVKEGAVAYVNEGMLTGPYFVRKNIGYATLTEAVAKVDNDETVTMLQDVTLKEALTITTNKENITLDLNGKTIAGTDEGTASFGLININPGAELTINGKGAITLTATNNRGWNAYSSVISNQRGKLTVNGGTIEHLGGTDMAYAIDNLTNTGAQNAETEINGGTVKSTYRAIRQFLNSTSAQNILTVNGGTIVGTNKSIWMQEANAKANPGTLTVTEDAELYGNVYISAADGATELPVEIAVASAALKNSSEVVLNNAPEYYYLLETNGVWGIEYAYIDRLDIVDGAEDEFVNQNEKTVGTLTYTRTFQEKMLGKWQTLYVPFEIPVSDLTDMGYEIAYFNDFRETVDEYGQVVANGTVLEMIVIKHGILKANFPYAIKPKTAESLEMNLVLNDVKLYSTTGERESVECSSAFKRFTFDGTYKKATKSEIVGNNDVPFYAMNVNGIMQAMGPDPKLGAFRVYMTITKKNGEPFIQTPGQAALAREIPLHVIGEEDENGATIIYDVVEDNLNNNGDDFIYDLQGRRVSEPKKGGIYIKNGKKILY